MAGPGKGGRPTKRSRIDSYMTRDSPSSQGDKGSSEQEESPSREHNWVLNSFESCNSRRVENAPNDEVLIEENAENVNQGVLLNLH